MDVLATIYILEEKGNIKILMPQAIVIGNLKENILTVENIQVKNIEKPYNEEYYFYKTTELIENNEQQLVEQIKNETNSKVVFIENDEIKELEKEEFEEKYNIQINYESEQEKEYKTIQEVITNIERKIMFQTQPLKKILATITNNQYLENKKNLILLGSKGVGKSKIIDLVAEELNSPYAKINNYSAENIMSLYLTLLLENEENKEGPQIIFIDGINKGIKKLEQLDADIIIELLINISNNRNKMPIQISNEKTILFDPKNINFIIALDLEKEIELPHIMGIGKDPLKEKEKIIKQVKEKLIDANYEIIEMNSLTENNLKQILQKSEISTINEYKKILEKQNTKLNVSPKAYELLAHEAYKLNKGAKGLEIIVNKAIQDEIISAEIYGNEKITINETKVLKKLK